MRAFRASVSGMISAALICGLATACRTEATTSIASSLSVRNTTADTLGYFAFERTTTNSIDPRLLIDVDPFFAMRVLAPGASSTVPFTAVQGYSANGDVRLFVYTIAGTRATYRGFVDATGRDLSTSRFRIDISSGSLK
jgi:hypothetical protein